MTKCKENLEEIVLAIDEDGRDWKMPWSEDLAWHPGHTLLPEWAPEGLFLFLGYCSSVQRGCCTPQLDSNSLYVFDRLSASSYRLTEQSRSQCPQFQLNAFGTRCTLGMSEMSHRELCCFPCSHKTDPLNTKEYSSHLPRNVLTPISLEPLKKSESHSVRSNSLRTHRLYSPWNSPGQHTGVCSHSLLQGIFPTQRSNLGLLHCRCILYQLSHQESLRVLEWVAIPSPVDLPNPGIELGSLALQGDSLPAEIPGLLTQLEPLMQPQIWRD